MAVTYTNLKGKVLSASAYGATQIKAVAASDVLTGSAAHETLWDVTTGTRMAGGGGDDFYYVTSNKSVVVESAGAGTDTVSAYLSYQLTANVENLIIGGNAFTGVGNDLDNIITAKGLRDTIIGGKGDDVLINAGAGGTRFLFNPGDGQDTVVGFKTGGADHDFVRIESSTLNDFAAVRSHLAQTGSDVVLTISATDKVVFKDKVLADFSADSFQFTIDPTKLKLTFSDEFNSLSLNSSQDSTGTWKTQFASGSQNSIYTGFSSRTLAPNHELELYVDPLLTGTGSKALGLNPFSTENGVLTITAAKTPAALESTLWGYDYTSGLLTTQTSFAQTYGYFEIRAQLPATKGVWPSFWLLPADGSGPAELDIFEQIGTDAIYGTAHSGTSAASVASGYSSVVENIEEGFHTYGMLWTAEKLVWYVDGVEYGSIATPAGMDKPMYMLVNMAVGGDWPGSPDASFTTAEMKVDYVRAYSLEAATQLPVTTGPAASSSTASAATTAAAAAAASTVAAAAGAAATSMTSDKTVTLTAKQTSLTLTGSANIDGFGNALDNTLIGNAGANSLNGGVGADTMAGGAGNDTYYIDNVGDVVAEKAGEGIDLALSSISYTLTANVENLMLTGTAAINGYGNDLDNLLTGNAAANRLEGGLGNDTLDGGKGADVMVGGKGDDTYYVDASTDQVIELVGEGNDTVYSAVTHTLAANVENLVLLYSGDSAGAGNDLNNKITGNSGANILKGWGGDDIIDGGAGNDTIDGGTGNDLLHGGDGKDLFVFARYSGNDTINDFKVGEDRLDLSAYVKAGLAPTLTDTGSETLITFKSGDMIHLLGVHASDLHADASGFYA